MKIKESIRDKKSIHYKLEELNDDGFKTRSQTEILVSEQAEVLDFPVPLREKIQSVFEKDAVILEECKHADLILKNQTESLLLALEKIDKEIEVSEKELKNSESADLKISLENIRLSQIFKEEKAKNSNNPQRVESNIDKLAPDLESKKALKIAQNQRRNTVEKRNNLRKIFSENVDEEWQYKGKSQKQGTINNYFLNNKKYREASEEIAMRLGKMDMKITQDSKNNSIIRISLADQDLLINSNNRSLRSQSFLSKNKENNSNLSLNSKTSKSNKEAVGLVEKKVSNDYSLKCIFYNKI